MKKEILRLDNVSIQEKLFNLSLHIFEGETVGLLAINALGIEQLLNLIIKNGPIHYGRSFYNGKLCNSYLAANHKYNNIIFLDSTSSVLVESLTIEDNLFVLKHNKRQEILKQKLFSDQSRRLLAELNIGFKPKTEVNNLPAIEKFAIILLKAQISGVKLVVIRNLSLQIPSKDINKAYSLMNTFNKQGLSFFFLSNHHQECFPICNRIYLIKDGELIKELRKEDQNEEVISKFSIPFDNIVQDKKRQKKFSTISTDTPTEFSCINLTTEHISNLNFEIKKGETIVLFDKDYSTIPDFLSILKSDKSINHDSLFLEHKPFIKNRKILSIIEAPNFSTNLFPEMPVIDNICFTCDNKIKNLWLFNSQRQAIKELLRPTIGNIVDQKNLYNLSSHELCDVLYQRILLQNPHCLFLVQPFTDLDMYERMHVIEYLDLFKDKGISICILAYSLSDSLQLAHRLLVAKKGCIEEEYKRSEFNSYREKTGSTPREI